MVHKNRLHLDESAPPALTVTGGTLAGARVVSGAQNIAFDAADADSGVASATAELGSTVVGTIAYPCAHDDWSACQRSRPGQLLAVDTTKAPDGPHELRLTVRDAANNAVTRSLGAITIANGPPAGSPNGANPDRRAKLTVRHATTNARSRTLRYGSQPTIRGRLVNAAGRPISAATIVVHQRRQAAGARTTQAATVQTAANGTFSRKLGRGPSRTVTVAYTAFSGDDAPATRASLRTVVRALVSAQVTPRSVRPARPITLTGRLRLLPREGIEVKIQAQDGRRWRTIDDVRTARRGTFRWTYRFRSSGSGRRYAFRVRVASPLYPFASGNSKPVFVRVR
ncbi:MAG: hypothetical protein Q8O56_00380 [Solirubrobacteraceae bacterium]|nr:hypothetical protein [Solirubrobacteraceae bacterium]